MKTTILLITHAKTKHFSTLWRLVLIKTEDKVYILNYLFLSLPVTCAGLPSVGQEGVPGGLLLMPPLRPGPSTLMDRRVGRQWVEIWQWREGTRLGMDQEGSLDRQNIRVNRVRVGQHTLTNTRATKCPIYLRGWCQIKHLIYEWFSVL